MKRRYLLVWFSLLAGLLSSAHASKPQSDRALKGMGMLVEYELAPGASSKEGVLALSDAGNRTFAAAVLTAEGKGTSTIGGGSKMSFPRWVQVSWRAQTTPGEYWTTGQIIGDYRVPVLERIPAAIFDYVASHPGTAVVLRFRLQDDGVLFGWAVQQPWPHGRGYSFVQQGGDF
ncbi:hypothetical protein KW842_09825 [Duganella sp. sic0402]|uniref:hypothetical protein n=1 Tax=Duganella sp. sic0402 TaxID=2854786 RepID=UPI001C4782E1|nr:hypothetical protein [Duganella sp. sic0402]MBV7536062.1 hypothetical protein [Duganella sp. sic0402]